MNQPDGPGLDIRDVVVSFGGVRAVDAMTLQARPGEILSLIGPNGAGKTTLLNAVSGFTRCRQGSIRYQGTEITRLPAWRRAGLGIGRTFQNLQLFPQLTALENVVIGGHAAQHTGLMTGMAYLGPAAAEDRSASEKAATILRDLGLAGEAEVPAGSLALASQKLLGVARALACNPTLLLVDEPGAGLSEESLGLLGDLLRRLSREQGMTVLLVEHHMDLVMAVSDRIVVMHEGKHLVDGDPAFVRAHPEVISVYLGTDIKPETAVAGGAHG